MFQLDTESIEKALEDVQMLVFDTKTNSEKTFDFQSFKATNHDFTVAAIDGSHHNVKGTNFVFASFRAGYLLYKSSEVVESKIDPIKIEIMTNNQARKTGFEYKHEAYYQTVTGELPTGKLEFDKVTERIRTLLEWDKIRHLIDILQKDDIIIFDGSFMSGKISTNLVFFNELVRKSKEKGITLVGLSKDTSLSMDSVSLPLVLMEASKKEFSKKNWFVQVEDTYFVKFTSQKEMIFRLDAIIPDHLTIKDVVSRVGAYCFDIATYGYPYPMQGIHDAVRISEMDRDHCFDVFKSYCQKANIPKQTIENLFSIYHDQLDKISYGR